MKNLNNRKVNRESYYRLIIGAIWVVSFGFFSCNSDTQTKKENDEPHNVVSIEVVDTIRVEKKVQCVYDTVLYGNHSKLVGFGRKESADSLSMVDTLVYRPRKREEKLSYCSRDLQMNLLCGPVKSVSLNSRPYISNGIQPDSTWMLIYEPFNNRNHKYVDYTEFDTCGKFSKGSVIYNNWNIIPDKDHKVKRDVNGTIKDVVIDAKEYGILGARYFYDSEGFLKRYNVCGYENGYKVFCRTVDGCLKYFDMEGFGDGEPYRYVRSFTIIDSDEYGNWTVRLCKEQYYPGRLYLHEGQENEANGGIISNEDIESWDMVIDWQNSWDKKETVSQFAVFDERPAKIRRWVEVRKIVYY